MEIYELRYFLSVAETENIHRASEKIHVSPPSLSKAISRLEDELGISLFEREGRNIKITAHGKLLQARASEILQLEESARMEIGNHQGQLQVSLAGSEVLLADFGFQIGSLVRAEFPNANLVFNESFDKETLKKIESGEAHIGFVTSDVPREFYSKKIRESTFQTIVAKGHPLFRRAKNGKEIKIEELLEHPFVSPDSPILGKVSNRQSLDGWRDDKFQRRIDWSTSSLSTLTRIVDQGSAVAYLPDYLVDRSNWQVLKVVGCPYSCQQKIRMVARNLDQLSWLRQVLQKSEL